MPVEAAPGSGKRRLYMAALAAASPGVACGSILTATRFKSFPGASLARAIALVAPLRTRLHRFWHLRYSSTTMLGRPPSSSPRVTGCPVSLRNCVVRGSGRPGCCRNENSEKLLESILARAGTATSTVMAKSAARHLISAVPSLAARSLASPGRAASVRGAALPPLLLDIGRGPPPARPEGAARREGAASGRDIPAGSPGGRRA